MRGNRKIFRQGRARLGGRCKQSRLRLDRVTAVRSASRAGAGLGWTGREETESNGLRWTENVPIFSWEIQYTFVLIGDPTIKLSLSPSGQTICNVKCVGLYYKSPTWAANQILCQGWPPILSHKDNLFIYRLLVLVVVRSILFNFFLEGPGFYNNSGPVWVGKSWLEGLAVICVLSDTYTDCSCPARPISLTMPRI